MDPSALPSTVDSYLVLSRLQQAFAEIPDTRQPSKVRHLLNEVLLCSFCAVVCDANSFTDMADFTASQIGWLRQFLVLKNGPPSHDTFRNVFLMLKAESMVGILNSWCGPLMGKQIAIDGKTLRGTHSGVEGRPLVHLLRAWVDERSISAGHVLCDVKSNEIEAIPRLLAGLEINGATVTIDAMGTQVAIAEQIHEAGADYVLSLKANQKGALEAVTHALNTPANLEQPDVPSQPVEGAMVYETLELSHGRCEKREYHLLDDLSAFGKSWKWAGLAAVGKVRREIQRSYDGPPVVETHYFLCSFKDDVERFARLVRGHWSVENRCHWVLDVTFGEDHCQVRDRSAAHNFSIMRELVLQVLRSVPSKLSLRRKRRLAALDPDYRLQIFNTLHA